LTAGIYNFTIEQGATFLREFTWKDSSGSAINVTGGSASMEIRYGDYNGTVAITLSSPAGTGSGITIGTTDGKIILSMSAATTSVLTSSSKGVYDMFITLGTKTDKFLEGTVTIKPRVTR
jgi:hypothetical protein